MKTSRQELKDIVKECLLEILSEGMGSQVSRATSVTEVMGRHGQAQTLRQAAPTRKRVHPLDEPVGHGRMQTQALKEAIKREAGGNPIMEAIFADTAKTTLPKMLSGGDSQIGSSTPSMGAVPGAIGQTEQFNGTPEDIFGDASSRWANLAFNVPSPGKNST